MSAKFIQKGDSIDFTPGADVPACAVVVQEDLVGVTKLDIKANELGQLAVSGVFEFPKETGSGKDILTGALCYWDEVGQQIIKAQVSGEKYVGKAVSSHGENDAIVRVRLSQ